MIEPDMLEIQRVRCNAGTIWCGEIAIRFASPLSNMQALGVWCLEKYEEDIEQAVEDVIYGRDT